MALMVIYMLLETASSDEDYLTKLFSRKSFDTHLSYLSQTGKDFGVVLFDLDDFKEINDRYGHQAGDDVLKSFADALKESFKKTGLTARIGGDEFAVIVYDDIIDARIDTLNALLRGHGSPLIREMSYSYGFQKHADGMTPDALFSAADHRMYARKQAIKAQII